MTPRIELLQEKRLVGMHQEMSLAANKTGQLWASFMPRCHEITHTLSTYLISLQIYPPNYFTQFSPLNKFEKWACVEVNPSAPIPQDMKTLQLPGGLYAVFDYQGLSSDPQIFQYIFGTWLPSSGYELDHRPHFEVLGEKYKNNDPNSEEEIWIPVKM
ncbi:AraC family transcriptional regulator [Cytophagaceae bacterium 50C-KIRBA]|uniref:AraC family transcriptional regulator n=1 Tax=Aquirufa beregesia TaxID=2516556 RepID=A0ABX0EVZ3_9BACT|nr:GyrI-like domain-containing protein [Aquirufa beregesia]NGZ44756.1 AraC family transcriptional regulator [Aquirufa beregesia]